MSKLDRHAYIALFAVVIPAKGVLHGNADS